MRDSISTKVKPYFISGYDGQSLSKEIISDSPVSAVISFISKYGFDYRFIELIESDDQVSIVKLHHSFLGKDCIRYYHAKVIA